jgi:hypothetical protein
MLACTMLLLVLTYTCSVNYCIAHSTAGTNAMHSTSDQGVQFQVCTGGAIYTGDAAHGPYVLRMWHKQCSVQHLLQLQTLFMPARYPKLLVF